MTHHTDTIIVGAGLSGLVIAHKIKRHSPDHRLLVLEQDNSTGGVIKSFEDNGFLAEYGPHGFLDNCVQSRELLEETGLEQECVRASLKTYVRYVCMDGKLMMIPQSPLKIIKAPLIPWRDKIRVLGDLFKKPLDGEPTVAKWADYRFGKALLPYIDAVFTGTYAGDYNELKIDAVMPGVRELERTHGSIIRGVVAKGMRARKNRSKGEKLKMPSMTSFPGGMQRLPDRLAELVGPEHIRLNTGATALKRIDSGWQIDSGHESFQATNLVIALPVNPALQLLGSSLTGSEAAPCTQIPEAWITTVLLGFSEGSLPPGFGFLTPEREGRFTLGTLFSSNMFPNRAPEGHILFETLIGGKRHPERLDLDDGTLIKEALKDVKGLIELPAEPAFARVLRPRGGIPQLEKGYTELLDWRNNLVQSNEGLYVCGFGWEGIGLNDMIKAACTVSEQIIAAAPQTQEQAEVKKVYF